MEFPDRPINRIAITSVDPNESTRGVRFRGLDNQVFRTTRAGMVFRINSIRILPLSFDDMMPRFAGMTLPEELLALRDDPDRHIGLMGRTDSRTGLERIPDVEGDVIAQTSFWLGNAVPSNRRKSPSRVRSRSSRTLF